MKIRWRSCIIALGLLTAACGTRVDGTDTAGGLDRGSGTALATPAVNGATAGGADSVAAPADGPTAPAQAARPVDVTPNPLNPAKAPTASGRSAAPATQRPTSERPHGGSTAGRTTTPTGPPAVPAPGGPAIAPKAPITVASVGTYTGPIGSILLPGTQTVQAWVSHVNERGGIDGHQVRFLIYDDGGDPARHRAQLQEAIERQRVIAFIHNAAPFLSKSALDYVTSKRVPVVGTETGTEMVYQSPMYFPQATSGYANIRSAVLTAARQMIPLGKKKLATLTCVEAQQCADADRLWAEMADSVGFTLVNRGRTTLTQPDYTAECLSARNALAEVLVVAIEATATARLALSCARQGYHPIIGTLASIAADRQKDDPNLDGMMTSSNVFPYYSSGTPATDEYRTVMQRFGAKIPPGIGSAIGWVAAKLFERAASNLPATPTAENILAGLWSLKNDTLGDLTSPLHFEPDKPSPVVNCWYDLAVRGGRWTSVGDGRLHCA